MTPLERRGIVIAGVIAVAVIAGALALALSGAFIYGPSAGAGTQLAANTPPPAQAQQVPPLGHMQLQAQYMGPLRDTVIQRWRDPVDGTVCYIYLPIIVQHGRGPGNLVQYGPNTIGSISCLNTGH